MEKSGGAFRRLFAKNKQIVLYEYFSQKFPEQYAAISVLARFDAGLRAVLADYEEISDWLTVRHPSESRDPDELERARHLARDLENEILNHLERQQDATTS